MAWHQAHRSNVQPKSPEAIDRREPNVGAIAFSRGGDPNVGEFKEAIILKTFGEALTISNGSDAHVTRRKESTARVGSIASFPIRSCCLRSDAWRKGRGHSKLLQNLTREPLDHLVLHLDQWHLV
jgi:hypothetical protein